MPIDNNTRNIQAAHLYATRTNANTINVYSGKSAYMSALEFGFEGTEQEWVDSINGKSAYQHAVDEGFDGTLTQYLDSLIGIDGSDGIDGQDGDNGIDGNDGIDGIDGETAYEVAVSIGFVGSEAEWLESLVGETGETGETGTQGIQGETGETGSQGIQGIQGIQGETGETGSQGIQGETGETGSQGIQGIQGIQGETGSQGIQGETGETGSQGIQGIQGPADGDSAYTVAVQNGFVGDVNAWLESLIGADGILGGDGETGAQGPIGLQGPEGPQGPSNGIVGPQGETGFVEGLDDILARITALEAYSPLTNVGSGEVSDITYVNKEEIVFEEQLQNTSITGVGGAVPWTPDLIDGMQLWIDASDLTSVPTTWADKSGQGNIMTHTGSPTLETDAGSGLNTIHYNGPPDKLEAATRITGVRTVFWVFNRDVGTSMNAMLSDTESIGPFFRDNGAYLWKFNNGLARHESNRAYVNGFRNASTHGGQKIPHELSVLVVKSNRYGGGMGVNGIGDTPIGDWYRTGFRGNLGELILFDSYLDDADIAKVEGYLAHKWNLNGDLLLDGISDHPHLTLPPMDDGGVILDNWTKSSGNWDASQLTNGILQGYGMSVSIRQTITTLPNEIYEVNIVRADAEEGLTVKLRTSTNVKWLTHNNDITDEVDIPFNTVARFEIIGSDISTYIELDTVNADLQITSCSLKRKKLAGGVITELTNNTIKKTSGGDSWNAGASSAEYINGQAEGYVQFQMAQSGKSIKVGLTYEDIDYNYILPYEMKFTGTGVFVEDQQRTTYITADWFRIRHDSVNNQIVYQKRNSDLDYITFYTHSGTTDGRHLYLDTSFYHQDGRINDVSMVNGGNEPIQLPKVMCLGDSITVGYTDNPTWNTLFRHGYREGLWNRMKDQITLVGGSNEPTGVTGTLDTPPELTGTADLFINSSTTSLEFEEGAVFHDGAGVIWTFITKTSATQYIVENTTDDDSPTYEYDTTDVNNLVFSNIGGGFIVAGVWDEEAKTITYSNGIVWTYQSQNSQLTTFYLNNYFVDSYGCSYTIESLTESSRDYILTKNETGLQRNLHVSNINDLDYNDNELNGTWDNTNKKIVWDDGQEWYYQSRNALTVAGEASHRGYGGYNISQINANISTFITADDPDVILLLIGINGGTTAQLNTLVSNIYTAKPTVKLIVAELTPKSTFQQYIVDLNTYITGTLVPYWTGEGRIIESVDLYSMFLDGNGNIDGSRLSNGINHPTNEMYDQIAKSFADGINSILF